MEENFYKTKAILCALVGAVTGYLGDLAIPFYLLVLCNIIDYATGVTAAPYRSIRRSSYRSFLGILKKVMQWLLVLVGWIMDQLITYLSSGVGWNLNGSVVVACVVCVWLMCNEIISIIENLSDIGVKIPPFLIPLVDFVKRTAEEKGDSAAGNFKEG